MQERLVHFATNRIYDGKSAFGYVVCEPPGRLLAGKVACKVVVDPAVEGIAGVPAVAKSEEPDSGLVDTIQSWLQAAEAAQGLPLLFVHGFNYSFTEATERTAALCLWLEEGGAPPLVPFVFTWPSNGMGSIDAYRDDQKDSAASGLALTRLIAAIASQRPRRAPVFMAHSMGARATRFGMQTIAMMLPGLSPAIFGQAVIMAGDDVADVLDHPWRALTAEGSAGGLRPLAALAKHVTIGVNRDDGVVWLVSGAINRGDRLGTRGPLHPEDLPPNVKVVDYSMVVAGKDVKPVPQADVEANWIGHQYFRNDPRVRADLVALLREDTAPEKVSGRRFGVVDPKIGVKEFAERLYPV
jgi:esterase/lipase superfamily enzyme